MEKFKISQVFTITFNNCYDNNCYDLFLKHVHTLVVDQSWPSQGVGLDDYASNTYIVLNTIHTPRPLRDISLPPNLKLCAIHLKHTHSPLTFLMSLQLLSKGYSMFFLICGSFLISDCQHPPPYTSQWEYISNPLKPHQKIQIPDITVNRSLTFSLN